MKIVGQHILSIGRALNITSRACPAAATAKALGLRNCFPSKYNRPHPRNLFGGRDQPIARQLRIGKELRLCEVRGTAAIRLLAAGAELKEIAVAMEWSIKHAAEVIENYVALSPQMSDEIGDKLARLRGALGTKL
ncbi:hypothetical protein [Pseudogemmobacter humi]|nr:hypothetical protein [Pseudogemmobacter humi]